MTRSNYFIHLFERCAFVLDPQRAHTVWSLSTDRTCDQRHHRVPFTGCPSPRSQVAVGAADAFTPRWQPAAQPGAAVS
eukprot:12953255-Heterocapsa_arctica.AAC.1